VEGRLLSWRRPSDRSWRQSLLGGRRRLGQRLIAASPPAVIEVQLAVFADKKKKKKKKKEKQTQNKIPCPPLGGSEKVVESAG